MQARTDFFQYNHGLSRWTKHPEVCLGWLSELQTWDDESPRDAGCEGTARAAGVPPPAPGHIQVEHARTVQWKN